VLVGKCEQHEPVQRVAIAVAVLITGRDSIRRTLDQSAMVHIRHRQDLHGHIVEGSSQRFLICRGNPGDLVLERRRRPLSPNDRALASQRLSAALGASRRRLYPATASRRTTSVMQSRSVNLRAPCARIFHAVPRRSGSAIISVESMTTITPQDCHTGHQVPACQLRRYALTAAR
jgi:hypothetical protein